MHKIKNIVFDVGMVLADFRWADYMRDKGIKEESIAVLGKEMVSNPLWDELDLGIRSEQEIIEYFKEKLPAYERDIDAFFIDMEEMVVEFPYAYDWIADLKKRGLGVYLLSNYPKTLYDIHWSRFSFIDLVDGKVISSLEQAVKPDEKIYRIFLERYALQPEECVFIDDRKENVAGAIAVGMESFLFENYEQARVQLDDVIVKIKEE